MENISLPRQIVNDILAQAQARPHQEICGLIGSSDKGMHCYPVLNISATPKRRYLMDGKEQIDTMRRMRENGETLFAIYHSHPNSVAEPSIIDIADAAYPEALYLIVSLNTEGVLQMRGFYIQNGKSSEVYLGLDM